MVQVHEGSCYVLYSTKQRWIQDLPGEKGHQPQSGLRQPIVKVFAESCMKMKEKWTVPSSAPSLDPPLQEAEVCGVLRGSTNPKRFVKKVY